VDRLVDPDTELAAALDLAEAIAAFPQPTLRSDRASIYAAVGHPIRDGLASENRFGSTVLGEALRGAAEFQETREPDS
jgi:enoyl-CoA hydratase